MERVIGEIYIDSIDGLKVMVIGSTRKEGCKNCAFATYAGGACPGAVYDRHPCCAEDRSDRREVYFRLIQYVPEKKAPLIRFRPFGAVPYSNT